MARPNFASASISTSQPTIGVIMGRQTISRLTFGIQLDTLTSVATSSKELRIYETTDGRRPFDEWLDGLKDKAILARIVARLNRVALGNLGDVKSVGAGVSELRLAFGKGYRVYFAQEKDRIILLLSGGDKGSQERDIREAKVYLQDYRRRDHGKKK